MLCNKFSSMILFSTCLPKFARRSRAVVFGLVTAVALSGCAVGPKYQRPSAPVPTQFKESKSPATQGSITPAIAYNDWWLVFNDATLNKLETDADSANQDIKLAVARVDQ